MRLTSVQNVRKLLNSPHTLYMSKPSQDKWMLREQLFRWTAWMIGDMRDKKKVAVRGAFRIWDWETTKRQNEKWRAINTAQNRLGAATAEHGMHPALFIDLLRRSRIEINVEMLAQLAINEPSTFKSLVHLTKQLAIDLDYSVDTHQPPVNVHVRGLLDKGRLPKSNTYPLGPSDNFVDPPPPMPRSMY